MLSILPHVSGCFGADTPILVDRCQWRHRNCVLQRKWRMRTPGLETLCLHTRLSLLLKTYHVDDLHDNIIACYSAFSRISITAAQPPASNVGSWWWSTDFDVLIYDFSLALSATNSGQNLFFHINKNSFFLASSSVHWLMSRRMGSCFVCDLIIYFPHSIVLLFSSLHLSSSLKLNFQSVSSMSIF